MKRIIFVFVMLAGVMAANAQMISKVSRPETYSLVAGDTMNIYKADEIVGIGIIVPSGATDSVWLSGAVGTIDGFSTGYVKLPPNTSVNFGYNDVVRMDSVVIIVKDEAGVILIPTKK